MRVLLDTNVILDLLLDRVPFAENASRLLKLAEQGLYEAYVSAITPVNVFTSGANLSAARRHVRASQTCYQSHSFVPLMRPSCKMLLPFHSTTTKMRCNTPLPLPPDLMLS